MNNEVKLFLKDQLSGICQQIVLSSPRSKTEDYTKITIKPYMNQDTLYYQWSKYTSTQVFHDNYDLERAQAAIITLLEDNKYRQWQGKSEGQEWHIQVSKKGLCNLKVKGQKVADKNTALPSHNRKKTYLLEEGTPVAFLVRLGVMTPEGSVVKKYYDKFKQINRFLEMVDDVVDELPTNRRLRIVDFGCGRSYLTFAVYHYLVTLKKLDIEMIGLDLKEQVINDCNTLANSCHYDNLSFQYGDIVDFHTTKDIDMVMTLHACDIATDLALRNAVTWHAKVILSVPCCQHELNRTLAMNTLEDIFQYGIIKERMAALTTDAMRANWLKLHGYSAQILEFIDLSHTPKNLMIRAVLEQEVAESDIDYTNFDLLASTLNADLTIRKGSPFSA